jgi:Phosphodiester glycosidase
MRRMWWIGALVACIGLTAIPAFTWAADAQSGLVAQSTISLAPGVSYTQYLEEAPRNVIDVTRISWRAPVAIKAVPASPTGGAGTALVAALCRQAGALACINGDFFNTQGVPLGGELVNGRWLRAATPTQQQLWVGPGDRFGIDSIPARATQSLGATSYAILVPGRPIAIPEHDDFADGPHARTLVGWDRAGDGFLATVEQGKGSAGMSLAQAAAVMRQLGATTAVNEDGGGSSQMVVGGVRHAAPGDAARPVANIWAVVALPSAPAAGTPSQAAPPAPGQPTFSGQWVIRARS